MSAVVPQSILNREMSYFFWRVEVAWMGRLFLTSANHSHDKVQWSEIGAIDQTNGLNIDAYMQLIKSVTGCKLRHMCDTDSGN